MPAKVRPPARLLARLSAPALLIGLRQKLHRMVCHLGQMILHNAISYVHAAAWAAGADIISMGGLDITAFAVINLP